jgi:cold shock CspA family protein
LCCLDFFGFLIAGDGNEQVFTRIKGLQQKVNLFSRV